MKRIIQLLSLFLFSNCLATSSSAGNTDQSLQAKKLDTATFATGCYWCTEAKFKLLKGVVTVVSGYTGGSAIDPTYKEVCTGTTGHAEACNIIFDPSQISYDELLAAFFKAHDPTQLNRQGNDEGTQYRSAIFYRNASQKQKALYYIERLNKEQAYKTKIITEVSPFTVFYPAGADMQDYFAKHPEQQYCRYVIQPEVEKFKKAFKGKLKQ